MILFVCTGNTCRSPMAMAMARRAGYAAQSAGLSALPGAPAAAPAQRTIRALGGDLSAHRAQQVSARLMAAAEAVYPMTQAQGQALVAAFPEYGEKVRVLCPQISDPYGGDDRVYQACAQEILKALTNAGLTGR